MISDINLCIYAQENYDCSGNCIFGELLDNLTFAIDNWSQDDCNVCSCPSLIAWRNGFGTSDELDSEWQFSWVLQPSKFLAKIVQDHLG